MKSKFFIHKQNFKNFLKSLKIFFSPHINLESKDPLFVIGTNRCGSSIVTSLIAQHNELEGLFRGETSPSSKRIFGHTPGYCESDHIWNFILNPESDFIRGNTDGLTWGHPRFISQLYRDRVENKFEKSILLKSIIKHRKTTKTPLIKDQMNILRIRMIKCLFPNAKFILVVRNIDDYIKSCSHKWEKRFNRPLPSIGLHWITLNTTAIYELEKYFPENYSIISYNQVLLSPEVANQVLNESLQKLGFSHFNYDTKIINPDFKFSKDNEHNIDISFSQIKNAAKYEVANTLVADKYAYSPG